MLSSRSPLLALLVVFPLILALAPGAVRAAEGEDAKLLESVETEVEHFEKLLDRRSKSPEDLLAWLNIVAGRHAELRGDDKDHEELREDVVELLIDALDTVHLDGDRNLRLAVNVRAAELLGKLAQNLPERKAKRLAKRVRRMLERLPRQRYVVHDSYVDALALLLAHLGHERSLAFLKDEYLRTEERQLPYIRAAMKAIPAFETISPEMRHDIVEEAVVRYMPLETAANTSANSTAVIAKKRVWDRIRTHAIEMMQAMARTPTDKQGRALNTVKQFQTWLREHDDPDEAPWTQPAPEEAGASS